VKPVVRHAWFVTPVVVTFVVVEPVVLPSSRLPAPIRVIL